MSDVEIEPVTPRHWRDLVSLFGENGAYSNCWCTWWISSAREFDENTSSGRRSLLHSYVEAGDQPGLLAYSGGMPVGWVAVGPRARYARMMSPRARVYGPVDSSDPGWVVNCFFIERSRRRTGVATALLNHAVAYAFAHGASYITAHPQDTEQGDKAASALFTGTLTMFLAAGFGEIERRQGRPVVRLDP